MALIRNFVLLAALSCAGQSVSADTERRTVEPFTEVAVSGGIGVTVTQGANFAVVVDADNPDDVVTQVVGDTLRIYRDRGWRWYSFGLIGLFVDEGDLRAAVTLPALTRVRTSGGASVRGEGAFTGRNLELNTSGGSVITLDLNYDNLESDSSGGSRMHLSGAVNRATMHSSGGSRQNADDLAIKVADLRATGGATLNVGVVEELTARASGGSRVRYEGDPRINDIDESGGGGVRRR
jgi:hypothetical protein